MMRIWSSRKVHYGWIGLCVPAALFAPAVRAPLESGMVSHVLLELPLLIASGMLIGGFIAERWPQLPARVERYSPATLLIALFTFLYWMLPQSLDASLANSADAAIKLISLPLLLGLPLALSGLRTSPITKWFVICNLLSMLLVLGWLYMEAPVRLCNFYLQGEQKRLGQLMLMLAGGLSLYWAAVAMHPDLRGKR